MAEIIRCSDSEQKEESGEFQKEQDETVDNSVENIDEKPHPKEDPEEAVLHAVAEQQLHEDVLPDQQDEGETEENPLEEVDHKSEEKLHLEREGSGDRESLVENVPSEGEINAKEEASEQTFQQYHPNPLYRSRYLQESEETEQKHFDYKDNEEAYAMLKESQDLISQFHSKFSLLQKLLLTF